MADFPTSPKPDYPLDETVANPEVLVSTHRDGTEQRRLKGAGVGAMFVLRFGGSCPITKAQRDTLLGHYATEGGRLNSFHWVHPEWGTTYTVRYMEAPTATLVAYDGYDVEIKLGVVPA